MRGRIKAVIFDMDGVLIDAKDWHYEALNRALLHFGFAISRYDHLFTFDGLPTKKKLEMLTREHGLPHGLHAFLNELKQQYTMELVHAKCKPIFQHEYALCQLQQIGYRLGVASNSIRATVDLMMARSNLRQYLDFVLSNEDVTHAKPAPDIYLAAASKLAFHPRNCLVVEDNPKGIEAAKMAGCPVMVVESVLDVTLDNIQSHIEKSDSEL
jgi:beta-phosphoglucomutase